MVDVHKSSACTVDMSDRSTGATGVVEY